MELFWLALIGFAAGTLGSLLGLGGGFLVVPALMLLMALEPRIATGTSVAVIVPTMLVTLLLRGMHGDVRWDLAWIIAIGAVAGAFLGSWLAHELPAMVIRRTFAVVLLGLACLLFFKGQDKKSPDAEPAAPTGSTAPAGD